MSNDRVTDATSVTAGKMRLAQQCHMDTVSVLPNHHCNCLNNNAEKTIPAI